MNHLPSAMSPFFWRDVATVQMNEARIQRRIDVFNRDLPKEHFIDEAAIMVNGHRAVRRLELRLTSGGWAQFNEAEDTVYTNPFGTRYLVTYHFFRKAGVPWRLEVMNIPQQNGFSPLHASLWRGGQVPMGDLSHYPMPHLSFKALPASDRSTQWAYSRAVGHLKDRGYIHAQTCQSTYGAFGYYLRNDATDMLYLKPRVNLRDGEAGGGASSPCEHAPDGGNHPVVGQ